MRESLSELTTIEVAWPHPEVAVATLNRPDRLNAMTDVMFGELETLARTISDDDVARVLVVTGAGRAFCAGFDLEGAARLPDMAPLEFLDLQERAARSLGALRMMRQPVIAAINGAAAGGGLSLALTCDIRLGSPAAKFNAAFVKIGLSAGDLGASWFLPRIIGPGASAELVYSGRTMAADEAYRLGLLNSIHDDVVAAALTLADQIRANSPGGVQLSKRAMNANQEIASYAAALELENRGQALLSQGEDMPEALLAMREKRAPKFTGR
jgi:enoyl-CoA hydratase/carnithine racemase